MKKVYRLTIIENQHGDIEYSVDVPDGYELYPDDVEALCDAGLGNVLFVPVHQRFLELLETVEEEAAKPDVVAPDIVDTSVEVFESAPSLGDGGDSLDELQHLMYCYAQKSDDN
jgi:hypothetical protein